MKNYEKYADKIKKHGYNNFCDDFIQPYILGQNSCGGMDCEQCRMLQAIWLMEEYEEPKEPEVDWSKVEVDTPILVRDYESQEWEARHFALYEDGVIYAWDSGNTSWTSKGNVTEWKYAKLAEGAE